MINLFEFENHIVNTADFDHLLHGKIVRDFEQQICEYVGAKYAASFSSASSAIYSILKSSVCYTPETITIPSMIPAVVPNVLVDAGVGIKFSDDTKWVGGSYRFSDKVVDSAQKLNRNQFAEECDPDDLLIFSMYPTKPLSSLDGGVVVSNNKEKIDDLKSLSFYGMDFSEDSWSRVQKQAGFKAYMSTMQATIASRNLKTLDKRYERIDEIRSQYNKAFNLNNTSRHLYRIEVKDNKGALKLFQSKGIVCGIHYAPMHSSHIFEECTSEEDIYTLYEKVGIPSIKTLSIPMHYKLTEEEVGHIIKTVKEVNV
jgi:UDP-4-amino-4,6-dideoxy-L-N-acetyl-beta-L-altrosamine transaminase